MDRWRCIAVLAAAALLQGTLGTQVSLWGVKPDMLLTGALVCGLYFDLPWACAMAMAAGAFKDVLGVSVWGMYALLYAALAGLMVYLRRKFEIDAPGIRVGVVALTVAALDIVLAVAGAGARESIPFGIGVRTALLEVGWCALLVYPWSRIMDRVVRPMQRSAEDDDDEPELLNEP